MNVVTISSLTRMMTMKIELEGSWEEIERVIFPEENKKEKGKVFIPARVKPKVRHKKRVRHAPKHELKPKPAQPERKPEREQPERAVDTMLRRKPVVPKTFDQERMALANVREVGQMFRQAVVPVPEWSWKTIVQQNWPLVNSIIRHVIGAETHQKSKLHYEPDGKMMGCGNVGEWRDFVQELLSKSGKICEDVGVKNHWSASGTGRDLEVWYG